MPCSSRRAFTPMRWRSWTIVRTSFRFGTLAILSGAAVSSAAARIGSAAFFAPATRTSPESGTPPWMESFCMGGNSARGPFLGRIGPHGQGVDFGAHALCERGEDELVLGDAREAGEGRAHDHRLEMRAIAAHLEVRAGEASADGVFDRARFDHVRLMPEFVAP